MTRNQTTWFAVAGAAVAAAFVALHLLLPADRSWSANRILHYVWEGGVVVATAGAGVYVFWRRPKAMRRDEERMRAGRRAVCLAGAVIVAVGLVVFGEIHRDLSTRGLLAEVALADLDHIGRALTSYAAEHAGARPASLTDLVPKHLPADRLFYAYRHGPRKADAAQADEQPSYVLAKEPPAPRDGASKRRESNLLAYLRAGHGWAPLTAVLQKDGRALVTSDDVVRVLERQAH